MIISASRRTDIPAFYAEWFMNRVRAGTCDVPNPFNPQQVTRVSLQPDEVDVIVFWTRHPRPLFPHLAELDRRGYRYYFQYTLLGNPRLIDPKVPPLETSLDTFRELAGRVGPDRVVWRYDPIVFSAITGAQFHRQTYERIARALEGHTHRSIISLVDIYRKLTKRLRYLAQQGVELTGWDDQPAEQVGELVAGLARLAAECGMEITSCAQKMDLRPYGVRPGKCIDDDLIQRVFGLDVAHQKDPHQREACGCVASRDIGMYETCLFGCQYCYATTSFERARLNYEAHDPASPALVGGHEAKPAVGDTQPDVQAIVARAKASFGRDWLTPGYSQLISDAEHLAAILKLCDAVPGKSYLDIGTGSGYVAFELARQHPAVSVAGVDIVEQVIAADNQKAQESHDRNLRFLSFAGTQLPFDAGSFYGAVSRYAFHHFPLPDLSAREIYRVLEPGGWCVISDPLADEGDDVDFVNGFGALRDDGHVRYYREAALIELFEKAGFTAERRFYSAITFPRAVDERYERLLAQTAARVLDLYGVRVEGGQIYITLRVVNVRFRK